MKKRLLALLMCAALAAGSIPVSVPAEEKNKTDYGIPGVDYVDGVVIACVDGGTEKLNQDDRLNSSSDIQMEELMDVSAGQGLLSAADGNVAGKKSLVAVSGAGTAELIRELSSNPNVEYAEPDYIMKTDGTTEPTDPGYRYQWGLKNQEDSAASNTDMDVSPAWNQTGSNVPVVAVIDTGVDYTNPDLKDVMWDEGENYPALTAMGGGKYGYYPAAGEGESTDDPLDAISGHGSHCAGIIAAEWDNGTGVAGIVPTDTGCRIMAIRMFDKSGSGDTAAAVKGYAYLTAAKKAGVNVVAVNNSWGPASYNEKQPHAVSTAAETAGELGIMTFMAAGNINTDNDLNPGGIVSGPYVVSIGAMDSQGNPAIFSCYGQRTVDMFAPGTQILSTASTCDGEENPNYNHEIPMQYLPELGEDSGAGSGATNESYFYEDFESASPKVSLKLYDGNGKSVDSAVPSASEGFTGGRGIQIPLTAIDIGATFSIEMTLPASLASSVDAREAVYLAFKGCMGTAGTFPGEYYQVQVKGSDGEWTRLKSAAYGSRGNRSISFVMSDSSWNSLSNRLLDPSALLNSTDDSGSIVLRLNGKRIEGESSFRLDDFGIGKTPSAYCYSDGTSMATPMAAGAAALLSTKYSDISEIIARLKGSVSTSVSAETGMASKCVTGGYVDAAKAFGSETEMNPVVDSLTADGSTKTAVIRGHFFGSAKAAGCGVSVGGQTVSVTQWNDSEITVKIPDGVSGNTEVKVTKGNRSGHNFLDIEPNYKGYSDLAVPSLTYETEGGTIGSADLCAYEAAAAGNTFCCLESDTDKSKLYLEAYDTVKNEWRDIRLPESPEGFHLYNDRQLYVSSMAGGKTKIYLLYYITDGTKKISMLGTLDPETDSWKTVQTALFGAGLTVYQNRLLAVGGEGGALRSVRQVDPTTGAVHMTDIPDLPEGRSCAYVRASGDILIAAGGYENYEADNPYSNTLTYDGTKWTDNGGTFFDASENNTDYGFDEIQTLDFAVGATDSGLIAVGPVRNLRNSPAAEAGTASGTMVDTWRQAGSSWSGDETVLFDSRKTSADVGAVLKGRFYVLGFRDGVEGNLVFRSLEVKSTDPTGDPSYVSGGPSVRLGGADRYATAAKNARQAFPDGADTAILACGTDWPDALAAAALAGVKECPVILTESDHLTQETANLIRDLKTKNVIVAGGQDAVSETVITNLTDIGIEEASITRLYGNDRTETSDRIAEEVLTSGTASGCIICSGNNFPDALSIASYAYTAKNPILLTDSRGALSDETLKIARKFSSAVIIGGEEAVSREAEEQLAGISMVRYGGSTRFETNRIIIEDLYNGMVPAVAVTDGMNFPDALTAAPLCGKESGTIFLTDGSTVSLTDSQKEFFRRTGTVWIIGGDEAVSPQLERAINEAMK